MTKQQPETDASATASAPTMTFGEAIDSMTGQDELDLWTAFQGNVPPTLNWTKRQAIFILQRRAGVKVADAKKLVTDLPASRLDDFFVPEADDEDDPDQPQPLGKPETESGKDDEKPVD